MLFKKKTGPPPSRLVGRSRQQPVDIVVAEERGGVKGGMPLPVFDPRIGAGREQALDLAHVAACDRGMEQRVSKRALPVGVAQGSSHA